MELQSKSVEMTDMERTKVMVEGIIEESIIDGEVARWLSLRDGRWSIRGSLRALTRRSSGRRLGIWEYSVGVGGLDI
jgi:hypothetical protein